ncbi:hypothetical protein PAEPH01_2465, partial [Pancytospora epiphaga]
ERTNQSLIVRLSKMLGSRISKWDFGVAAAVFQYNITPSYQLEGSPFELAYGFAANVPLGSLDELPRLKIIVNQSGTAALDQLETRREKQKVTEQRIADVDDGNRNRIEKMNTGREPKDDLGYGDIVRVRRRGTVSKLKPAWAGPFWVCESNGKGGVYTVRGVENGIDYTVSRKDLLRIHEGDKGSEEALKPLLELQRKEIHEIDPEESKLEKEECCGEAGNE